MMWGKMHCIHLDCRCTFFKVALFVHNNAEWYGGVYREQKISLAAAAAVSWGRRNLSRVWVKVTKAQTWKQICTFFLFVSYKTNRLLSGALEKEKIRSFDVFCPSPPPEIVWIDQTEATWSDLLSWRKRWWKFLFWRFGLFTYRWGYFLFGQL